MTELISNSHNSIGFEIEAEAKQRVDHILKDVKAGKTYTVHGLATVIKKLGGILYIKTGIVN